jgi:hypothetical protein
VASPVTIRKLPGQATERRPGNIGTKAAIGRFVAYLLPFRR